MTALWFLACSLVLVVCVVAGVATWRVVGEAIVEATGADGQQEKRMPFDWSKLRPIVPLAIAAALCLWVVTWHCWWPWKVYSIGITVVTTFGGLAERANAEKSADNASWILSAGLAWPLLLVVGILWGAYAMVSAVLKWIWESLTG